MTGCSKSSNNSSTPAAKDSVLYSSWITLAATYNTTDSAYEQALTVNALTQNVLDHGLVLTYIKDGAGEVVTPQDFSLFPAFTLKTITLFAGGDFSNVPFRYVIIPGTLATSSTSAGVMSGSARTFSVNDLKSMTYAQVIKAFNIPADGASK